MVAVSLHVCTFLAILFTADPDNVIPALSYKVHGNNIYIVTKLSEIAHG